MSDTITPETAPATAPETGSTAPATAPTGPLTLDAFLRLEGEAVDAQIDQDAFGAGVAQIIEQIPNVARAESVYRNARYVLAAAIIACRNAVTFHSKPDTFGASKVYKRLFSDWIVSTVLAAHPTMQVVNEQTGATETVPTDRKWIKNELDYVRINYLGSSATRSKGLLLESVIRDAATSGKIPGAKVAQDGTITAPVLTRKKDDNGNLIPKVDSDGKPVVATYKPGQAIDVPAFAKKVVQEVIATAPVKKDPEDPSKKVPTVLIPTRFGGAEVEKGSGGGKPKKAPNYAEMYRAAFGTIVATTDNLAVGEQLSWFHAATSVLIDTLNKPGLTNPKDHAKVLLTVSNLLKAEAGLLDGNATATLEKVQALQFHPEDAPAKQDAPKDDTSEEDDNS